MELKLKKFKDVDLEDVFFDSLKNDYSEFSDWFEKKSEDHAYVFYGDTGIDGFLYLKLEEGPVDDVTPPLPAKNRLKVGTMKINPHGTRMGERFIKKIFDHALRFSVEEIYVTVFSHHQALKSLFCRYGFSEKAKKVTPNGEELVLVRDIMEDRGDQDKNYPVIYCDTNKAYLLSLHPIFHTKLLPDSKLNNESFDVTEDVSSANSIHKVYLTAMDVGVLRKGDVLVVYRTNDGKGPARYRSVATSVGVIEERRTINSFSNWEDFYRYCRPHSVFSRSELESFWNTKKYPQVLKFSYNLSFSKRITRGTMIDEVGLREDQYWGFFELSKSQLRDLVRRGMGNESLIVNKA